MEAQWQDNVRDKHHWTTWYKWWSDNDMIIRKKIGLLGSVVLMQLKDASRKFSIEIQTVSE